VSQASRRQFQSSSKILWSFQLSKSWIPCSHLDDPVKHLDALLCQEDSDSLACIRTNVKATPSDRSLVFEKNSDFLCRHGSGKTTCNCLDAALIWKCVKRIMEMQLHSSSSRRSKPPFGRCLEKSESVAI
jgi:hypothetical protein